MADERLTPEERITTLTSTCDQLQAEVDRHGEMLALLLGAVVGTCILIVMLEVRLRRLPT